MLCMNIGVYATLGLYFGRPSFGMFLSNRVFLSLSEGKGLSIGQLISNCGSLQRILLSSFGNNNCCICSEQRQIYLQHKNHVQNLQVYRVAFHLFQ